MLHVCLGETPGVTRQVCIIVQVQQGIDKLDEEIKSMTAKNRYLKAAQKALDKEVRRDTPQTNTVLCSTSLTVCLLQSKTKRVASYEVHLKQATDEVESVRRQGLCQWHMHTDCHPRR